MEGMFQADVIAYAFRGGNGPGGSRTSVKTGAAGRV